MQPARQVSVIVAAPSGLDPWGSPINGIDLTTDRPMSPFPAEYTVSCANLVDQATGTVPLSPSPQSIDPPGLLRHLQSGSATLASPNRDFLNPQTASSLAGSTAGADSAMYASSAGAGAPTMGTFVVDSTGDYAIESGVSAYKKRVFRRGLVKKGRFLHLPKSYGVGILDAVKQLGSSSRRDQMAADYQSQILQEPETAAASVTAQTDPSSPSMVRFIVLAKMKSGAAVSIPMLFNLTNGSLVSGSGT